MKRKSFIIVATILVIATMGLLVTSCDETASISQYSPTIISITVGNNNTNTDTNQVAMLNIIQQLSQITPITNISSTINSNNEQVTDVITIEKPVKLYLDSNLNIHVGSFDNLFSQCNNKPITTEPLTVTTTVVITSTVIAK